MTTDTTNGSPTAKVVDLDDIAGWVEVDQRLTAEINRLGELHKANLAELVTARDDAREQVQRRMGDAVEARVGGRAVVTWKWKKAGSHLDQKALRKDNPELIARYTVPSQAARTYVLLDQPEADHG
ncbi:MAG: hypothetical protein ACRDP6_37190 [Actinoallomurus sp.]